MKKNKSILFSLLVMSTLALTGCNLIPTLPGGGGGKGDSHTHTFSDNWSYNETKHWHEATCDDTDEVKDLSEHEFGDDDICDLCGYQKPNETSEFYYYEKGDTRGVKMYGKYEASYPSKLAHLDVGDTFRFGVKTGNSFTYLESLEFEGPNQGFTVENGVFTCHYKCDYEIGLYEAKRVEISLRTINFASYAIYRNNSRSISGNFFVIEVDVEHTSLISVAGDLAFNNDNGQMYFVLIDANGYQYMLDKVEDTMASKDFQLAVSAPTYKLNYIGEGNTYDFYLIKNYVTEELTLRIEYSVEE